MGIVHSYVSLPKGNQLPTRSHETKPSIRNRQALDHQLLAQTATPLRLPLTWVLGLAIEGEIEAVYVCCWGKGPKQLRCSVYMYILCQVGVAALLFLGHETIQHV